MGSAERKVHTKGRRASLHFANLGDKLEKIAPITIIQVTHPYRSPVLINRALYLETRHLSIDSYQRRSQVGLGTSYDML